MTLRLHLDSAVAECGDRFTGTIEWGALDIEPSAVRVQLRWWTEGRGDKDGAVSSRIELPGAPEGSGRFELTVPPNGPITFDGRLMRVRWVVELVLDHTLRPDPDVEEPVTVLPRGGVSLWARMHAPAPVDPPAPG